MLVALKRIRSYLSILPNYYRYKDFYLERQVQYKNVAVVGVEADVGAAEVQEGAEGVDEAVLADEGEVSVAEGAAEGVVATGAVLIGIQVGEVLTETVGEVEDSIGTVVGIISGNYKHLFSV